MANLESLVSLCKRRGFVYQTADIYGGLNGLYDFGHLGTLMLQNIRSSWISAVNATDYPVLFFEGSLIGPESVWKASGHVDHFHDPMVDCLHCKHRYRADEIDLKKACPHCGKKAWTDIRAFNMMFSTKIGADQQDALIGYLRPETAQSIFVQFKNIISTHRVKLPFGVAQIGKAFRNEINPKHFLFRVREFEQMELEWFCKEKDAQKFFIFWRNERLAWYNKIGIAHTKIRLRPYAKEELSHYSQATSDIEYEFPFGWKELEGIAHRGNYDLSQHTQFSGKELGIFDEEEKVMHIPHVVETSVGVGRLFLTLLFDSYHEEMVAGEQRIVLKLAPTIAPIKVAILPLTKDQINRAQEVYKAFKRARIQALMDESGSIGKRYRRQDEIGTPLCITIDPETTQDNCVTVRNRDTMKQERVPIATAIEYVLKIVNKEGALSC